MNSFGSFALPSGYEWDIKKFAREVKTKAFIKRHEKEVLKYHDRLTSSGADNVQIIGGMLQAAYGANIGRQVEAMLKPEDFKKIKLNILQNI